MVLFGQIVIGPPGAGKTSYCHGMSLFTQSLGRDCAVVNLDFANDCIPFKPAIDVRDLISQQDVMDQQQLGPNGSLLYCMEYLLDNINWLLDQLSALKCHYVIFDCPGQVELFTHHKCMEEVVGRLRDVDCRLCSVHLVDSFYCCQPTTFISAVLTVAASMLRLGLPHVNVLTKIDLLPAYGPLPFNLDFYTEMIDLVPLTRYMDGDIPAPDQLDIDDDDDDDADVSHDEFPSVVKKVNQVTIKAKQYRKMTGSICELLSDMGLVSFLPMNVQDGETVARVLAAVDKANGYNFAMAAIDASRQQNATRQYSSTSSARDNNMSADQLFRMIGSNLEPSYARSLEIMERYETQQQRQPTTSKNTTGETLN